MIMGCYGTKYDNYIRRNYLNISPTVMAKRKGLSKTFFLRRRNKLGLIVPKEISNSWKRGFERDKSYDKIIRADYLKYPVKTLAKRIGKSHTFVVTAIKALKLQIPKALIEQRKNESRYPKGHMPANKGKKFPGQGNSGSFKKGEIAPNKIHFRDRMVTLRFDSKSRRPYWWIRISLRVWKMYHVELWERENGPLPAGYIVVFKDKNSLNCIIENLEIITLEENMRRNTIHNLPPELKSTIHLIGRITRKIKKHEKQNRRCA